MKMKRMFPASLVLMSLIGLMAVFFGCEDEPSMSNIDQFFEDNAYISDPRTDPTDSGLIISPAEAVALNIGQQIRFSVTGGEGPMMWNVATEAAGTIVGQQVDVDAIYTVVTVAENNIIVSDRNGRAAIANITREVSNLSVTPSTVSIGTAGGQDTVLTATGGTPPYDWQVVFPDLGSIAETPVTADGHFATYSSLPSGVSTNGIVLIDSAGKTVQATVKHIL